MTPEQSRRSPMRTFVSRCSFLLLALLLLPAASFAQAAITGVVKDASGGVLPGVTVEAASPVLIEKLRTAVTDGTGQYRIVDLRAGTYTVTFELTGVATTTINTEMRVGTLAETITVTAESPIVDVQSVQRQTTVAGDVLNL